MPTLSSGRVLFGAFELDLNTGELRSIEGGDPDNKVLLREQVFQVLRMLLEREGKIVTREEIRERLWANDTVETAASEKTIVVTVLLILIRRRNAPDRVRIPVPSFDRIISAPSCLRAV